MSDFSGLGLVPGVVRGARSFNVDALGRLTGISYPAVWTPGENVAECHKTKDDWGTLRISNAFTDAIRAMEAPKPKKRFGRSAEPDITVTYPEPTPKPAPAHSMATCSCGFYAYYDGSNDYRHDEPREGVSMSGIYSMAIPTRTPATVSAVIEGYGEAVVGSRGFRAAKARIVALYIPSGLDPHLARRVAHNYSELPIFESFEDMVAEFPTDPADSGTTPETDPDFWTRSI